MPRRGAGSPCVTLAVIIDMAAVAAGSSRGKEPILRRGGRNRRPCGGRREARIALQRRHHPVNEEPHVDLGLLVWQVAPWI